MTSPENYTPAPAADFVLAFDLPSVRGRLIRLEAASAAALSAHVLPEGASRVLAETLTLGALLGSTLKLDGRLSAQVQGKGPLDLVATDYFGAQDDAPAGVRGYARADEAALAALGTDTSFAKLVGEGALAITIEPRLGGETYQGIVQLDAEGIAKSAEAYFAQSEQLPTAIRLAAVPVFEPGQAGPRWRAGGMLIQATPDKPFDEDDWERLKLFLSTIEDFELVDTGLSAETLLWRLFHEDEVRVHTAEPIVFRCNCDGARIAGVLKTYAPDERAGLADEDGVIRARCEFCGTVHEVREMELA